LDVLRRFRLLETAQLEELSRGPTRPGDEPRVLARSLIDRGWLTPYQANQLLQGRGQELLLGSYVLLERIGEGGMGAVFKARNWKLGQVVALKLMREQRVNSTDAVKRFQREVRAAAQLDHPNIVRAWDADEVNGSHLLVMEFVAGIDLAKMVRTHGPLPVAQACEYIRQAALGLQHAFERGLVHRDIKPSNLFVTQDGACVKILDFGLARLGETEGEASSTTLTREGAVMGTLDYIAPEQAIDSHQVDIRADLYSLGCTFYHLLTGKVPFPGGEALAKLLKHRIDEPTPLRQLRPEVPEAVSGVVRKLMAKLPTKRYQSPVELVITLQDLMRGQPVVTGPTDSTSATSDWTLPSTPENPFVGLDRSDTIAATSATRPEPLLAPVRSRRLPLILAGGFGLLLLGGLVIALRSPSSSRPATGVAVGTRPSNRSRPTPQDQHPRDSKSAPPPSRRDGKGPVTVDGRVNVEGVIYTLDSQMGRGKIFNLIGDTKITYPVSLFNLDVVTNGFTLTLDSGNGNAFSCTGSISGTGNVEFLMGPSHTRFRDAPMVLGGDKPNTTTGKFFVKKGRVQLEKPPRVDAISGDVIVGGQGFNDCLFWKQSEQLKDTVNITLLDAGANGAAYLALNGCTETAASLMMTDRNKIKTDSAEGNNGTLIVKLLTIGGRKKPAGEYTAATEPWIEGQGKVIVRP
jgi:serine/threonine protein kinase